MARSRFVLRYRGEGAMPEYDVTQVVGLTGAAIVDASPRMLLVESETENLRALVDTLAGWVMAPEQSLALPDTPLMAEAPPRPDDA